MQIEQIALYHHDGRSHVLRFELNALNIVTGVPRRGKSALLEIVDYCLGREEYTVPEGKVRDVASWYGVAVVHRGERTWLLRPVPSAGRESTSSQMLIVDADREPPSHSDLVANADRGAVRQHLSRRLGVESGELPRGEGRLKQPLRVSVAQAVLVCLQGQNEITSKTRLFHRQEETHIEDDLRAALPYLLGAVDPQNPALRSALLLAERTLKRAERRLEVGRRAGEQQDDRQLELLAAAEAVGLPTGSATTPLASRLRAVADAPEPRVEAVSANEATGLLDQRRALLSERRDLDRRLSSLVALQGDANGFADEAGEQGSRLQTLGLLPRPDALSDGAACPVCGSDHTREALAQLSDEIRTARAFTPQAARVVESLRNQRDELDDRLSHVDTALRRLAAEGNRIAALANAGHARAHLRGRISEYLNLLGPDEVAQASALQAAVDAAARDVEELSSMLDDDLERERVDARLDMVATYATYFARALGVEHVDASSTLRLNLARMTAVARTPTGPKWLPTIGSGSNWVGYHLAVHLGLHRYLADNDRPVPRFLMIDQPTQAFYPEDADPAAPPGTEDLDRAAVRIMFRTLFDAVAPDGAEPVQIIVCDHAKLRDEQWFMDSVRYDWRGPDGLVPAEWLE
jgi:hypothetical protein